VNNAVESREARVEGRPGNGNGDGHAALTLPFMPLLPWLRKISSKEEVAALAKVAAEDQHQIVGATHLAEKNGQIIGYASIGAITMLNVWADSKNVHARESAYLLNLAECTAAAMGLRTICLPCAAESPFLPYIDKLGYHRLGSATFNLKQL